MHIASVLQQKIFSRKVKSVCRLGKMRSVNGRLSGNLSVVIFLLQQIRTLPQSCHIAVNVSIRLSFLWEMLVLFPGKCPFHTLKGRQLGFDDLYPPVPILFHCFYGWILCETINILDYSHLILICYMGSTCKVPLQEDCERNPKDTALDFGLLTTIVKLPTMFLKHDGWPLWHRTIRMGSQTVTIQWYLLPAP